MNNKKSHALIQRIKQAHQKHSLFYKGQKILVGLSGGADSTALLLSLNMLCEEYGFTLGAVHVNHMIRGKEANRDEEFSKKLCKRYGIDFYSVSVDIPLLSQKNGESLELCARNQRYRIFERICMEKGYNCTATAHSANDNAETFIINALRGSSLKGLCAIPIKRPLSKDGILQVIRPLLYVERNHITDFLFELGEDYVTDSTNLTQDYTRNYVRQTILPAMKKINPDVVNTLCSCADTLSGDSMLLEGLAEKQYTDDVSHLKALDNSILCRILAKMYCQCAQNKYIIEKKHLEEIAAKIKGDISNNCSIIHLPGKISCLVKDGRLCFEMRTEKQNAPQQVEKQLDEGINTFCGDEYIIILDTKNAFDVKDCLTANQNIYKLYNTAYICSATMLDVVFAKTRQNGDRILLNGQHKSVKRLLCDRKIPLEERSTLPFMYVGQDIAYIPCVGVSDLFKQTNNFTAKIAVYKKVCGAE